MRGRSDRGQSTEAQVPLTDLDEILAFARIGIPASAELVSITPVDRIDIGFNYNIEFVAPEADNRAWAGEVMGAEFDGFEVPERLSGEKPDPFLEEMLGIKDVPPGSRYVRGGSNKRGVRCNVVILLNAPDFTRVNLGIEPFEFD